MIVVKALDLGLTLSDLNELTVGMIIDIMRERVNMMYNSKEDNEPKIREATQADFDKF